MIRLRRVSAVVLACSLVAAACGTSISGVAAPTGATSDASDPTSTLIDGSGAAPDPAPTGEGPGVALPLTGLPATDAVAAARSAVAVKVDNSFEALPQRALGEADVVVEYLVEGGLSRLVAVFHGTVPASVGPVRSARSSDPDIVAAFGEPGLVFWGSNEGVAAELADAASQGKLVDLGLARFQLPYYREEVPGRPREQTGYVRLPELVAEMPEGAGPPPPPFDHRGPGDPAPVGEEVAGVGIDWGAGQDVSFVWSEATGRWLRSEWQAPHVGEDGVGLGGENVVILVTAYGQSAADERSPQAITTGEGEAWVLTAGVLVRGRWSRADPAARWEIIDETGNPVSLTPGQTWIELPRAEMLRLVDDSEAASLVEAAEVYAGG